MPPKKVATAKGYKRPPDLPNGYQVPLVGSHHESWRVGKVLGKGGFGDVYLGWLFGDGSVGLFVKTSAISRFRDNNLPLSRSLTDAIVEQQLKIYTAAKDNGKVDEKNASFVLKVVSFACYHRKNI